MATYYVSSVDGNNADTGADWANAKQTVAGALAVATTTGDVILVDSAHAFTATAAITWNASAGIHVSIISTDRTNGGVLAGAAESVGATNAQFTIAGTGAQSLYLYGLTLTGATGNSSAGDFMLGTAQPTASVAITAVSCTFNTPSTNSGAIIQLGSIQNTSARPATLRFDGCTFGYAPNTGHAQPVIVGVALVTLTECVFQTAGATQPPVLIAGGSLLTAARFIGCDFSAYTGADLVAASGIWGELQFSNCKLHSTPALAPSGTWPALGPGTVTYLNADSGYTEYKYAHYTREGAITIATGTYASDSATVAGQALSWKIDTTADADEDSPFVTPWVSTWIDSTGSKTLSLELLYDSASNYDDREIWAEIEYLGNASYPISTVYSSRNANPFTGTGTDLTAGSATWTEALTNDNKDKITTTVTVNGKGLARARLFVAVASTTIYLDPQLRVA